MDIIKLGDNIVILKNVKGDPIMSKGINSRKVAVIGTGFVGSSSAFALMESGLFTILFIIYSYEYIVLMFFQPYQSEMVSLSVHSSLLQNISLHLLQMHLLS